LLVSLYRWKHVEESSHYKFFPELLVSAAIVYLYFSGENDCWKKIVLSLYETQVV